MNTNNTSGARDFPKFSSQSGQSLTGLGRDPIKMCDSECRNNNCTSFSYNHSTYYASLDVQTRREHDAAPPPPPPRWVAATAVSRVLISEASSISRGGGRGAMLSIEI